MTDILLADLRTCTPATALDSGYRPGTWRLVDYQTSEFSGTMVYSGPGMGSPELTLPLHAAGPCAIYLGLHYPAPFGEVHVRVRLTEDAAYTLVRDEVPWPKDRGRAGGLAEGTAPAGHEASGGHERRGNLPVPAQPPGHPRPGGGAGRIRWGPRDLVLIPAFRPV